MRLWLWAYLEVTAAAARRRRRRLRDAAAVVVVPSLRPGCSCTVCQRERAAA